MEKQYRPYVVILQLDLLCYRADHLPGCPCRDSIIRHIEALNIEYGLPLAS